MLPLNVYQFISERIGFLSTPTNTDLLALCSCPRPSNGKLKGEPKVSSTNNKKEPSNLDSSLDLVDSNGEDDKKDLIEIENQPDGKQGDITVSVAVDDVAAKDQSVAEINKALVLGFCSRWKLSAEQKRNILTSEHPDWRNVVFYAADGTVLSVVGALAPSASNQILPTTMSGGSANSENNDIEKQNEKQDKNFPKCTAFVDAFIKEVGFVCLNKEHANKGPLYLFPPDDKKEGEMGGNMVGKLLGAAHSKTAYFELHADGTVHPFEDSPLTLTGWRALVKNLSAAMVAIGGVMGVQGFLQAGSCILFAVVEGGRIAFFAILSSSAFITSLGSAFVGLFLIVIAVTLDYLRTRP
jgi:hypothetical protein